MKTRISSILALMAVFSLLFLGAGCKEGPAGPAGSSPAVVSIVGAVEAYWNGSIVEELEVAVGITNSPSMPRVKVNEMTVPMYDSWILYGGRTGFEGYIYSDTGFEEATLEVNYTKLNGQAGVATATVTLPEEIDPVADINIFPYNDVDLEWTTSNGADAFWVNVYGYSRWLDASSVTHYKYFEFDTVLTDTTLHIPSEVIFPDPAVATSVNYYYHRNYIYPVSGPWLPGATTNIEGDGIGVFVATCNYEYVRVYLTIPMTELMSRNETITEAEDNAPAIDIIKIAEELAGKKFR